MKMNPLSIVSIGLISLFISNLALAVDVPPPKISLAGKKVLWLGDDITFVGNYVALVQYYLLKTYPTDKFDIISIGLSSETASGLSEKASPYPRPNINDRLQRALELTKPDIVIACYGMNDGIYQPQTEAGMKAFENGMQKMIAACHAAKAQVVLLTPPPFDKATARNRRAATATDFGLKSPYEDYDSILADYVKWEKSLPASEATVIDLHGAINTYIASQRQSNPHFVVSKQGVTFNRLGHLLIAETILKDLGVPVHFEDDLAAELKKISPDTLWRLVYKQRAVRSNAWLPYVGYTLDASQKTDSVELAEQLNVKYQARIDAARISTQSPAATQEPAPDEAKEE